MHLSWVHDIMTYWPVQCSSCKFTVQLCFIRKLLSSQTGGSTDLHIERELIAHMSLVWRRLMPPCICAEAVPADNRFNGGSQENCFQPYGAGINQVARVTVRQQELVSSPPVFACFSICVATPCSEPVASLTEQLCMPCWCSSTYSVLEIWLIPIALWSFYS